MHNKEQSEPKTISQKKVLFIELDDEVTMIFDRIKKMKMKDIYLVVPKGSVLFQSLVNLKILKRKVEEIGKELRLITNDKNGVRLSDQIGLPAFERVETGTSKFLKIHEDSEMKITPLKATVNALEDDRPILRREKKISISELLGRGKKKKIPIISKGLDIFKKKKEKNVEQKPDTRFVLIAPNRQALFGLIAASTLILLIIFYIALPGATLYLTPKSNPIEQSVNISFADFQVNKDALERHTPKMLASYPIEVTIHKSITHASTGKIFEGQNAQGDLTIVNTRNTPWPLLAKTRFQTADGLVFRTTQAITVPPSGTTNAHVIADEFDINGQAIGARGNIGPTRFILPGLSPDNQKLLYAESKTAMSGGMTQVKKQVSEEDLKAAQDRMQKELEADITNELQKAVDQKSSLLGQNVKFSLLKGSSAYTILPATINVPTEAKGQLEDTFEVSGDMKVQGWYFNTQELLDIMKAELKNKRNPEKRLVKVDDQSITYRIFDTDPAAKIMKVTATIKALEEYDIDPSKSAGEKLIQKIKEHIAGKRIADAKDYVINLPEISQVQIKSWPVWAPTIPSVPDNIDVEILKNQ